METTKIKEFVKLSNEGKIIIIASLGFAACIAACQVASNIGDHYFPKERFESKDFWNWKPK